MRILTGMVVLTLGFSIGGATDIYDLGHDRRGRPARPHRRP